MIFSELTVFDRAAKSPAKPNGIVFDRAAESPAKPNGIVFDRAADCRPYRCFAQ